MPKFGKKSANKHVCRAYNIHGEPHIYSWRTMPQLTIELGQPNQVQDDGRHRSIIVAPNVIDGTPLQMHSPDIGSITLVTTSLPPENCWFAVLSTKGTAGSFGGLKKFPLPHVTRIEEGTGVFDEYATDRKGNKWIDELVMLQDNTIVTVKPSGDGTKAVLLFEANGGLSHHNSVTEFVNYVPFMNIDLSSYGDAAVEYFTYQRDLKPAYGHFLTPHEERSLAKTKQKNTLAPKKAPSASRTTVTQLRDDAL